MNNTLEPDLNKYPEKENLISGSWTEIITPKKALLDLQLGEVWRYRDLLFLFVKRDFIATYKQTVLGPLWFFIQPIITVITYSIVFGYLLGVSTGGTPRILFYLGGLTVWNYFSECMLKTGQTFVLNANIFGKVYFPRLVLPISIVISGMIKMGITYALFLILIAYYIIKGDNVSMNAYALLAPVLLLITAVLGLGVGIIISALTTKYRDLLYLVQFTVQLLMYATPVIYPLSRTHGLFRHILLLNPMTAVVETFRYGHTGAGGVEPIYILYSAAFAFVALAIGTILFNKTERTFMDTI
ncbi:ABC transporter permease [Inquilinus sp. KBS0705]|nr:ABC transporter permease [Inquilinus sp. KBS0705]